MSLGSNLFQARKKSGFSQEEVAEKLGVSRQTISKWELGETLPDICQSKRMAELYHLTLDELIEFDPELKEIERFIETADEEKQSRINWTELWGKKYPVLTIYQQIVRIQDYTTPLKELQDRLKTEYGYHDLDAFLVLKDILAQMWNQKNNWPEAGS